MRLAAFLDRDGTIVQEGTFINTPEQMESVPFLPDAIRCMQSLQLAGFSLFIVTNQAGVARGHLTEMQLHRIHRVLDRRLMLEGIDIVQIRACTHDLDAGCECRKPKPGMILSLAHKHQINLRASIMIGNEQKDVEAGQAAGCLSYLLCNWSDLDLSRPEGLSSGLTTGETPGETQLDASDGPLGMP